MTVESRRGLHIEADAPASSRVVVENLHGIAMENGRENGR
jgi:hypothetical protein